MDKMFQIYISQIQREPTQKIPYFNIDLLSNPNEV